MPDTTTPPKDPRLVEAEIAEAEANARKAAAEATVAQIGALIPDIPKVVTAGSLTTPDAPPPIASVAAYLALGTVGSRIAAQLPKGGTVWIVPDGGFQTAIDTCDALTDQLERLTRLAQDVVPKLAAGQAGFVPPGLGFELASAAVPLVMSLFSTSRTVVSAEVTTGFTAAAAAVAAAAARRVYVLGITPPLAVDPKGPIKGLQEARDALDKALVDARGESAPTSAEAIATARADAWKVALAEEVKSNPTHVDAIVDKIAEAVGQATDERNNTAHRGHIIKSCEQLLQTVDEVLQAVSSTTGAAIVAQCALGAALKKAHVLVLQPTYSGAESTYEDLKLRRDRALHTGTCVVTWYLLEKDKDADTPLKAGIEWAHRSATTKVGLPEVTWTALESRPQ